MAYPPDSLTAKREHLESQIRECARDAGVRLDALRWDHPPDKEVSVLTIESAGKRETYEFPHRDASPHPGLRSLTDHDLALLAANIVRGLQ